MIRILSCPQPTRHEPNLTGYFIDPQDLPNGPRSTRHLIFDRAGFGIIEPEMAPSVSLAHPE